MEVGIIAAFFPVFCFLLFFSQFTCEDHSLPVYHAQVQIELILHKEPKKFASLPNLRALLLGG